jgi:hypothetical protein
MTFLLLLLLAQDPDWPACLEAAQRVSRSEDRPLLIYSIDNDG